MHSSKKILKTVLILVICGILLKGLDTALYPCTFMRNDVHAVVTEQFDDIILGTSHGKMDIDPEVMEEITGRTGHNLCVGGEYGIDAYYLADWLLRNRIRKELFMKWIRDILFLRKKKATITCCFIMNFLFQRQNWNISGTQSQNVISVRSCFPGMNIL